MPRHSTNDSTSALVLAAVKGSGEAFNDLIRRYMGYAEAVIVRKIGRTDIVEDILQETLIAAWQKLETLRDPALFRSWLAQIASNATITATRRNPSGRAASPCGDLVRSFLETRANGPLDELVENEFFDRHRQILESMRQGDREILAARAHDGLTMEELASTLDLPIGTAKRRLHTARARYSARLSN